MNLPNNIILTKSRQVKHCPPHFVKISVDSNNDAPMVIDQDSISNESIVRNWCHENIENRFFVGRDPVEENSMFVFKIIAAFEDPIDATFFSLVLPRLLTR